MKKNMNEPLYFEKALVKVAGGIVRLEEDFNEWPKKILSSFFNAFPQFTNSPNLDLKFTSKKPEVGYAVGYISAHNFSIPIVIRDFTLLPLDVAIVEGKFIPLNSWTAQSLASNPSAFEKVVPFNEVNQFDFLMNPQFTNVNVEPNYKVSFLDELNGAVLEEDKNSFMKLASNPEVLAIYNAHGNMGVLEKIAALKTAKASDVSSIKPDFDIYFPMRTGPTSAVLKLASSVYDVEEVREVNNDQFEMLAESFKKDFPEVGSVKTASAMDREVQAFKIHNSNKVVVIDSKGYYKDAELLSDAEDRFNVVEKIAADWKSKDVLTAKAGDTGFFRVGNDVVGPFKVASIHTIEGAHTINTTDIFTKTAFIINPYVSTFVQREKTNDVYVPMTTNFIKAAGEIEFEVYSHGTRGNHSVVMHDDSTYSLRGPVFKGAGFDHISADDAQWTLLKHTGNLISLPATPYTPTQVDGVRELTSYDNVKTAALVEYDAQFSIIKDAVVNMVKEAGSINDQATVDAVLSLHFINPSMITYYTNNIDAYEQILSDLTKLVLLSRLGLNVVDEEALTTLLDKFSKVIEQLRGLTNLKQK